ncbi:hypothetical protein NN561_004635 [Cricetulus griseus]
MADRKTNGGGTSAPSSGTNLLFSSSATEFSFNVPFIPVTQAAASPASLLLPGGSEPRALGGQCVLGGGWDRSVAFSELLFRASSGQLPEGQGLCDPGGGVQCRKYKLELQSNRSGCSALITEPPPEMVLLLSRCYPVLSCCIAEDSTDVGEEDSFLGQTSAHTSTPQTFSYFSQVSSNSDPFGNIGQSPSTTTSISAGQSAFSKPPATLPFTTGSQDVSNAFPPSVSKAHYGAAPSSQMGINTYLPSQPSSLPPNFGSPPQGIPQQGHNPYRHTPVSSRANPYLTPPQLQQCQTPGHPSCPPPTGPPVQTYQMPPGQMPPAEYKKAVTTNQWHRRLEFPSGETIVMHNPKVIVQFQPSSVPDEWGTTQDGQTRPRVVKRGIDDNLDEIPDGEMPQVDHLVFMVHGIGPVCDLRFRSIIECVDDFRVVSLKLLQTHFKKSIDDGKVSRVEFLPVHWHSALGGHATGVDRNIKKITLQSIGRFRHFTNETLLDILFYNSPTYCQSIVEKVGVEINRLYSLFLSRNPNFKGKVSVAGHSLGSLILFDILSNQKDVSVSKSPGSKAVSNGIIKQPNFQEKQIPEESKLMSDESCDLDVENEEPLTLHGTLEALSLFDYISTFEKEKMDMESLLMCTVDDLKEMGIPLGPRKKIANFVKLKAAKLEQKKASEKKVVMAAVTKGQDESALKTKEMASPSESSESRRKLSLGAYVSSARVDYESFEVGTGQVSVTYTSLDFEPEIFFALGSPVGMFLTIRGVDRIDENYRLPTCKGFFNIYHPLDPVAYRLEPMVAPDLNLKAVLIPHHKGRKRLHLELKESLSRMGSDLKQGFISSLKSAWQTLNEFARAHTSSTQLQEELEKVVNQFKEEEENRVVEEKIESPELSKDEDYLGKVGMLNGGRRIDYVLQEKPIESFNEYLFALQSHLCYWESEDTALLLLKEIYRTMDISPEQPQH